MYSSSVETKGKILKDDLVAYDAPVVYIGERRKL